nr:OmpA family protein [Roseospira goensis]
MAPAGAQPLSAYGPLGGARSQRVAVIYFGNGSAGLSGRDRQVLEQVAALQRQYGGVVRVVGHASSRTGAMDIARHKLVNFNISLARANRVADALMSAGVPGRFLYVGAVSDSQPVYYEIMPTGEAGNRRAEIYLDY